MARIEEVLVTLVDDIDGGEAAETVTFGLDGKSYEIDLSKRNAAKLRRSLKPYVEAGRTSRRAAAGRRTQSKSSGRGRQEGYDRAEVRAWAKAHRIRVAPRGRISNDVVERWRKASST
jgi:hypothetical protein